MRRVAIIGAGNMGSAIIKGIKKSHNLIVSDINKNIIKKLGVKAAKHNVHAIENANIIILAIKPQIMDLVLEEIKNNINANQLIISIAAGITTKKIEDRLGRIPVVRVMPNMPLLVGMGMSVICRGKYAGIRHIEEAKKIFSKVGKVLIVRNEKLMDAVTAVSGSGPAYIYLFIESLIKSSLDIGLDKKTSEMLVNQTIKGSIALLEKTRKLPEELRKSITSPGGTTQAALNVLEKKEFDALINEAIFAAHKRSKELRK